MKICKLLALKHNLCVFVRVRVRACVSVSFSAIVKEQQQYINEHRHISA